MSIMSNYGTDDVRWAAVRSRERAADGRFVFSVRSTGVYCRPGCASRTPRRENVAFHADWRAAEAAGFRACKRCAPAAASADEPTLTLIRDACRRIEGAEKPPTLEELASAAGLSRFHFHRLSRESSASRRRHTRKRGRSNVCERLSTLPPARRARRVASRVRSMRRASAPAAAPTRWSTISSE